MNPLDLPGIQKNIQFSRESAVNLCLIFFILVGLVLKCIMSFFFKLDSDSVGMGLLAMEIGKHSNILLSGYHLLSSDSLVFTELIPFQLIPQIITGYNPSSLKIVTFCMFVLSVAIFSCILFFVSKRTFPAILFAALAVNIPMEGYHWLAFPTSHNATLVFGAVILLILLNLKRMGERQQEMTGKTRKRNADVLENIPWVYISVIAILGFFSVLADTIILVWLIVPFILAYLVFAERKTRVMNLALCSLALVSGISYVIKTFFIPEWLAANYGLNSFSDIAGKKIPLFFQAFAEFLNSGLLSLLNTRRIGPLELFSLLLFAILIVVLIKTAWPAFKNETPEKKFLSAVILMSLLIMAGSFIFSGYVTDINAARYLTFPALLLLLLVALFFPERNNLVIILVTGLLVVSAVLGCISITTLDFNPNEREYNLIAFAKSQDLAFGYGTYWDSNVVTYLSGEQVTIRSTYFLPDTIRPFLLNSCDRWYESRPARFFLINDTTLGSESAQSNLPSLLKAANVSDVLHYRGYDVYPINTSGK